ncbi:MAG: flavodoxin FldA [Prevotella sp.]|uniref:flavodoxin FldA n=1 Tax=Prevotella sp. TaxID=59823 RepID=UPI002A2933BB|nr:flavodoxin FldA [Prevotella sp.]MDD7317619.1 flavodoxin FldA [Prevotellaceae bacterium]MDY4020534.1 flavodoxin FldA [Prevotella sp.]
MGKTIVVYGSSTGTCESIAEKIAEKVGAKAINVADLNAAVLSENDNLLIGTSTWGAGEVQDDWYDGVELLRGTDLAGKVVAVYGCGDSAGYGDTFCAGMKALYDAAKAAGATLVGEVGVEEYSFDDSDAVVDGKFVGLALDDVNEDDLTESRIDAWLEQIKGSFK